MEAEERLQDVEDPRHLSEDQDAMAARLAFTQETRELLQLATVVLEQ